MIKTSLFVFLGLIGMILLKLSLIAYNVFMGCLMIVAMVVTTIKRNIYEKYVNRTWFFFFSS